VTPEKHTSINADEVLDVGRSVKLAGFSCPPQQNGAQ
jgi:hypothetical protein